MRKLLLALVLVLWLHPLPASGHGEAPGFLDVASIDESGMPTLVIHSRGAMRRLPDQSWQFLCPSLWSGPAVPLRGITPDDTWIAGDTFIRLSHDMSVPFTDVATPVEVTVDPDTLRAMTGGERVALLTVDNDGTNLSVQDGNALAEPLPLEGSFSTMTTWSDGRWAVARPAGAGMELALVSLDAMGIDTMSTSLNTVPLSPRLHSDNGRYFVSYRDAQQRSHLTELAADGSTVATLLSGPTGTSIDGLLALENQDVLVVMDGQLHVIRNGGSEVVAEDRQYTCLARSGTSLFACSRYYLVRLDEEGLPGEEVLSLLDATEPPFEQLESELRLLCQNEWLDFVADAGRPPQPGMEDASESDTVEPADQAETVDETDMRGDSVELDPVNDDRGSGCGCRTLPATPAIPHLAALTFLFVVFLTRQLLREH